MRKALAGARLFAGDEFLDDRAIVTNGGRIEAILPVSAIPDDIYRQELNGGLLVPGFIDLQVNGGGGVLFNDKPTIEGIAAIGAAHRCFGVTAFLPTLITDFEEPMRQAASAVRHAVKESVPGVIGIHLEGPFISPARKGIHNAAAIRKITEDDMSFLCSLGIDRALLTLAPEEIPSGTIRRLCDAGITISAGHTAASYERLQEAIAEGLTCFTHLYNAMEPLGSREPAVVGAALDAPNAFCGIIADGHHVHPASLRIAHRAKGTNRLYLVSDAMSSVGSTATEFNLYGRKIQRQNGRLTALDGTLAGADIDMATCVRNAVHMLKIPLRDALTMASTTPATCIGIAHERGRIAPGYHADITHLNDDLIVQECWIAGRSMTEDGFSI